jgi:hypothetical protein
MVSSLELLGLALIVLVHAAVAALGTRFFRVRLRTRVGSAVFAVTVLPVVLVALTLVFGGVLGIGPNLGSPGTVLGVTVLGPLVLGVAFDYFWMPAPGETDLPAGQEQSRPEARRGRREP